MISGVLAAAGVVALVPVVLRPRQPRGGAGVLSLDDLGLIRRAEWGARAPDLLGSDERPYDAITYPSGWMVYDQPLEVVLKAIIVHHSALPLTDGPREIQNLHMDDRRFADVGYHFLIDEAGRLFEGRALNVRGAHTAGHNTGAIGIMLMGNFEEIEPAGPQWSKLEALSGRLAAAFPVENLAGHRDYNPGLTVCPGDHLAVLLPGLAERLVVRYGV